MVTGFHGLHVTGGVIYLLWVALRVKRGYYDDKGYEIVEMLDYTGTSLISCGYLYSHFSTYCKRGQ